MREGQLSGAVMDLAQPPFLIPLHLLGLQGRGRGVGNEEVKLSLAKRVEERFFFLFSLFLTT